jgi:hypothetical protein
LPSRCGVSGKFCEKTLDLFSGAHLTSLIFYLCIRALNPAGLVKAIEKGSGLVGVTNCSSAQIVRFGHFHGGQLEC